MLNKIKENLAWASISLIGFLFVFYVNSTYMTREAYAAEMEQISEQLDDILHQIKLESARDQRNLKIDGLQDALADIEDEIVALQIYIDEAPDSTLTAARQRRIHILNAKKTSLQRELEQIQGD